MSFAGKNLTQGGQMTAYRWRMFLQVNNWIGFWIFILFAALTSAIFFWRIPQETLNNGSLWWFAWMNSSFIDLMPATGIQPGGQADAGRRTHGDDGAGTRRGPAAKPVR
ncbi:hypothetical protein [Leclercia sp. Marseille-Q4284]|uniref:hypothetical protein n=1 Tax=Leclercia sp. Marseille-Q4284 TaxID=2866582 RepID=UPI001CE42AE8|nr:hypothetical protein [Leclercia sp. Marseille-Q4284]